MSATSGTDDTGVAPHTDTVLPDPVSGSAYDEPSASGTEQGLIIETSEGAQELFPRSTTGADQLRREAGAVLRLPEGVVPERFEVVVNLLSLSQVRRVRVRVQVPATDAVLPTLFDLYPGTEAMEREAYDLLGVVFTGHPDMTRILLPEDWEGHPLRKDYGVGRVPVQFKGAPGPR